MLSRPTACVMTKSVTRLDGARGKKQIWRPHVRTWGLSEAIVLHWRRYLWHCWAFSAPPAVIRWPHSDSEPGELCPPCPPHYALDQDPVDQVATSLIIPYRRGRHRFSHRLNILETARPEPGLHRQTMGW